MTLSPQHPALAGLPTPALVVDRAALERNISAMAATARAAGLALRPHAKTHKCAEIARLQLAAGALGVGCATLAEAEALAAAGIGGILVTSPVVGQDKLARLARLARDADVMAVVDHVHQVDALAAVLPASDRPLRLVIDVDVGQARTGVTDLAMGLRLAQAIAGRRGMELMGIQGYAGHAQHIAHPQERMSAAAAAASRLRELIGLLQAQGLAPRLVSGSGTGAHRFDLAGPYTELQVGSYVFMDADYATVLDEAGQAPPFTPSLFVLAAVVSANRAGQVTVDAGTKALATNGPMPQVILGAPPGANYQNRATYKFGGDEHGIIRLPEGAPVPELGARMLIGATHCDPTVNLHSAFHVVGADGVQQWAVLGRY